MKETVTVPQMLLLWAGYVLAQVGTFIFLMWEHWPGMNDGWAMVRALAWSGSMALAWPVYWPLRWIM